MLMTILCGRYLSCKRLLLMRLPGSAVLLVALIVPGILTQPADRFLISPIALQLRPLTDVEPRDDKSCESSQLGHKDEGFRPILNERYGLITTVTLEPATLGRKVLP